MTDEPIPEITNIDSVGDDSVFRTKIEEPTPTFNEEEQETKIKTPPQTKTEDEIEVPYLDYKQYHNRPYIADHFKLGDTWEDQIGGFSKEIESIEEYIKGKINSGDISNSVKTVNNLITQMEKFNNLDNEDRAVVKLSILSNYVRFMMENSKVKSRLRRSGKI